jgi:drug/metabolite transporter (DMT)-like permease
MSMNYIKHGCEVLRMHPAQFVSLLFAYAGILLIVQAGFGSDWQLSLESVFLASTGVIIFANAPLRMRTPIQEQTPAEYGPLVYVLVVLCAAVTILTAATVFLSL